MKSFYQRNDNKIKDDEYYFRNLDRSKYFQELLEKWDPIKWEDKNKRSELVLRDSFLKFLESKEPYMEHYKEYILENGRRADIAMIYRTEEKEEIKHFVEFKYGLDSTGTKGRLNDQIEKYYDQKVRHVYVVIIEDDAREVKEELINDLKKKYSKLTFKIPQKFGFKGIHLYVKRLKKKGKNSVARYF